LKTSDLIIEGLALVGKINVESSSMNEPQKEFSKFGIDVGKELVKELIKTPEEKLIDCARLCGIQKITQNTYLFFKNLQFTSLSIEGGNINRFCYLMGLNLLSQPQKDGILDCINRNDCVCLEEKILYLN
jgi:hypothetical protein